MYNPKDNYCSWSPDGLFGVKFNFACYLHDRQYRNEVKERKTRKQADKDLRNKIREIYSFKNKRFIGFFVSWFYYASVRMFSKRFWIK